MSEPDEPGRDDASPLPARRLVLAGILLLLVPIFATPLLGGVRPDFALYPHEWVLLAALTAARVFLSLRTRGRIALAPPLDLPLLGLVFVLTGAEDSPLDPALFLVYALVAFYVERVPLHRWTLRYYGGFVTGFAAMYGLVLLHVYLDQRDALGEMRASVERHRQELVEALSSERFDPAQADALFEASRAMLSDAWDEDAMLRSQPYFAPSTPGDGDGDGDDEAATARGGFDAGYESFAAALARRDALLAQARDALRELPDALAASALRDAIVTGFERTNAVIDRVTQRLVAAFDELVATAAAEGRERQVRVYRAVVFAEFYEDLDKQRDTQERLREGVEGFIERVNDLERNEEIYPWRREQYSRERVAMAVLVLATLALVAGLRAGFEEEVTRREAARSLAEVARREQETENWIALSAGLTHTIGNDILAYDAYGAEALALARRIDGAPPELERNLRFIHESNKARMGFVKFLDEFARARKQALDRGGASPTGLSRIDLDEMLQSVRRRVGEIEVADLPRESGDPEVEAQVAKFTSLPLAVRFASDAARHVRGGKRGVLDFFFYELIKNALRNASGERPIEVHVAKRDGRVHLTFVNDLALVREDVPVEAEPGRTVPGWRIARLPAAAPYREDELRKRVEEVLAQCFEPGKGGGTGLGLFLIRYFVREYYRGRIEARIHDWDRRLVAFELVIADDLADPAPGGDA